MGRTGSRRLPPARPFGDYIAWLRKRSAAKAETFWRQELVGFTAPNSLRVAPPAGAETAAGYAEHGIDLSREVTAALQALAARHKVTLQTVTLGTWALLLSRYSGEEDVVFGNVVSGRPAALPGVETMVGMFVNTLPVRVRVNGAEPLGPWLRRLQERQLARQDFEHTPLAQIQRWSEVPAGSPLFETLYAFENYPDAGDGGSGGLQIGDLRNYESTNYPVTLVITATDQVSLQLRTDRARMDGAAALRLLQQLATLLAGMAGMASAERPIAELPLIGAAERHQLLREWSNTATPFPSEATIHGLFADQARLRPDAVAVEQGGEALTWGELRRRAGRLARRLVARGLQPEERVAVLAERSPDLVVALLGILEAGGAYLPLDPANPPERLAWMVQDAGASLLVAREAPAFELPPGLRLIVPDSPHGEEPETPEIALPRMPAESLAYVMYTSGSTGKPKGVAVTHRNVLRLVRGAGYADLGPDQTWLQTAPLSFDPSTVEIWVPLLNGGRLVLYPGRLGALDDLARVIETHGVTSAWLTTGLFHEMVDGCLDGLRPLSQLLTGGDVVSPEHARRVLERHPGLTLVDGYGPTEGTTFTSCHRMTEPPRAGESVPIGRPISNTRTYVLDERLAPVPVGVEGELYAGGEGLARGYLDRPDLTAERFVPDPFGPAGERLYRTGDRVRWRADGTLDFRGRLDHQVKLRGFRVELGEVETALMASPGVREAAVLMREDRAGDRRLVAYVVGDVAVEDLRRSLRERLPDYMVPAAFVTLAAFPFTANGKVDRKALPAPALHGGEEDYLAPRTPVEETLAGIWAELLGLERVGAADNFFELGGHSLLATRVMSRLREAFGVELPLRDFFEAPGLADLAARVEAARRAATLASAPPLLPVPREGDLPLSFAQERLWLIDQLEPGSPLYNIAAALRAEGPLDSGALARVLGEIVRRHEALRTVFASRGGAPVQGIRPAEPFALPLVDLSALPDGVREALAPALAREEAGRPFDLAQGPVLRCLLLRLTERDHAVALTLHHIAGDGWSMGILVREVAALYPAFAARRPSPLSELPVQYADFAVWQRSWLLGEVLEQEIAFWRRQLAGLPPLLELATDRPRPAAQSYRGATRPVRLPAGLSRQAEALGRQEGATLFMVLLAAFQALLARYSGQDDLAVGSPVAGRNRVETEGLIGFFVNTLVLRGDLSGTPTFRQLLGRARETALAAWLHQDVPFEKLVEELAPERSLAHAPLFQVVLVLQNASVASLEVENLRLRSVDVDAATAKFDLTVNLSEHDGGLIGVVEHATDLFDATTVDRLFAGFERLLAAAVAGPDLPAAELPLLGEAERHQLLEWGGIREEFAPASTLHGRFAARARQNPDAPALTCGEVTLSYGELDRRSNQLARWLREQGAGPESRVGLRLDRSVDLVVGILGVLKAGAAYVPLDPGSPRERQDFILEDAEIRIVVGKEELERLDLPAGDLESLGDASSLAYVIYTSGSTGRPKGALITHANVARLFDATESWFGFCKGDRCERDVWTLFHSYAFDFSVWEIWGALLHGGRLVIVPWEVSRSPELFLELLVRERVTVLNQTPSAFAQLAQVETQRGAVATDLRLVIFGGEALDPATLEPWFARHGDTRPLLVNMYGITETTVHVTCRPLSAADARGEHRSVIGVPIPDLSLIVMDRNLSPTSIGVPGELVVGGAGLARGYLGRPGLTAERFVPDPAGGRPGARLYRSGDLGRFLPNGEVEYLGRLDHQVKIRGFRIELGEIETALAALPGVRQAVVMVREESGDRRLVAYVVGDVSVAELRASLRERLPDYMVPAAFVTMAALSLTVNGKVDRKALPTPEQTGRKEATYLAPRTPVEEVLAGIWADVLGLERVGAADHFFDLGGHSLLATRVMSRLREAFGVELPLRDLFVAPVLADLATRIEAARRAGAQQLTPPLVPLAPTLRERALPLSSAQKRLWFIDQLEPGSPLYNLPAALRVKGPLNGAVLALCLGEVVRRHEALRTVFSAPEGSPVQFIQPAEPFLFPMVDLSALPESTREDLVPALAAAEAGRPFDLTHAPLLRGLLVRLTERDHAVVLNMHHIASDGWSIGILVREVAALYPAFAGGRPSPLPELPVQYADFAVWQRSWLHGEVLEQEIDWWRRQLAGLPPLLELPTDRPRPAGQSYHGATRPVCMSAELTRRMEALARHEGATLFMVLLAAFQVLLARYSGQDDLAVGSPVAGRNRVETEGLIGFFVNTLVLRGDLSGTPTFRELLGQVRETALAAWLHQDVPFERLVEELAPERSLAHAPLFQAVLVLQNAPVESLEIEDLRLRPVGLEGATAKFDLTVNLSEHDGGLLGFAEHATDLLDAATIDRLLGELRATAGGGGGRTGSAAPRSWRCWRGGAAPAPGVGGHPSGIRDQPDAPRPFRGARPQAPEAPALTCGEVTLSYGELHRRSNQLARWLRRQGAGPESRVGLHLDRSVDLVVGILGVLKAGAAYVPLDPGSPRERLAFIREDAQIRIVVGVEELELLESLPAYDLVPQGDASSLAYVIYTSGSTGRPKGALITHGNVARLFDATESWFGFCKGDRCEQDVWTLFHSYAFDFSVWEIWGALLHGGRLVIVPWEVSRSPELFLELLVRERVTVLNQTPSAFAQLARAEAPRGAVMRDLRLVIFGGEALDPASLEPWFERHGDARPLLVNMYGITETTVHVTYRPLSAADARSERRSVIGVPIADLSLTVMDRNLTPAPIGVPGELVVGGAGLARGYLGRPELTAERFVPDPAGGRPGARLYRSGDLGRFLPNGDVEYLGRLDHQVKIRGFRIELGEIEAALAALPGVRQAVVMVREEAGDRRLVAYLVGDVAVAEPRRSLLERLPDYMVPAAFVTLEAFPLTVNGKVDRKALPVPEQPADEESYVAPRTPAEEVLAGIWADLLGLERVGAAGNFFDLGGHSLLATQVMSRLRQGFGVEMPLHDLFEAPVLADLAARIEAARRTGALPPAPPLLPVLREGDLPLSFAQQRLWFIDRVQPGSPLYNIAAALRAEGPLDAAVLALCLGEVARRHETLRTVFAAPQGLPVQVIQPAGPFLFPVVDLSALPESAREDVARTLAAAEATRPFDLAQGPMLRGLLLRLAGEDHAVLLTLHHIASDGWSMGLLVREVAALYPAFAAGRPSPLPEPPVQYADFSVWQRSWLRGEVLEREIDFWRQRLAGLPPLLELPTDRPRPAVLSYRGATRPVRLPDGLVRQAEALGRREGATLFMVLLAAFQALLGRISGQDDFAVGSPVAGRNRIETEELIGFFVNTLVLRGDLTGAPTFRELLGRVRETALTAWTHQEVPFERLVEELAPERSLAYTPLFQAMFALQNAPFGELEIQDLRLRPVPLVGTTAKADLTVSFAESGGALAGEIEYATALLDAATIERLGAYLARLLAAAVADPDVRGAELPLLSDLEHHQLLAEWNDTGEGSWEGSVTSLVERWCRERPDSPAVVDAAGCALTYGELGERAGRLAGFLRDTGVGPESIVAVLMERSADLLVAQLGVLKAGAAYLSLDPAHPAERVAFMLEETAAPVVLTRESLDRDREKIALRAPAASPESGAGPARLRDLHLRLDGAAQGGADRAPRAAQPGALGPARARHGPGGPPDAGGEPRVRRLGVGDLGLPGLWGDPPSAAGGGASGPARAGRMDGWARGHRLLPAHSPGRSAPHRRGTADSNPSPSAGGRRPPRAP